MARCFSGRRLRAARIAAGLPVERLALEVQRTSYSIREYETGRVRPRLDTAIRMADLLGVDLDDLLDEEVVAS